MRDDHRFRKQKGMTDDQKRILSMAAIPLIVIVLIIIILIADHGGESAAPAETPVAESLEQSGKAESPDVPENGSDAESGEAGTEADADGADEAQTDGGENIQDGETDGAGDGDAFASENFQKDSVPEILELMKQYFQARVQADAETMNALYGVEGVSAEALEAERAKLRSNAKYVRDFQNITTYVMNGTTADSWLVYTLADIQFYTAETAAPMIMWCYMEKNPEGVYHIVDNSTLSSNVQLFIDTANHSQEVRRLAADVNGRLKKALSEDTELNTIYGVIRDGSPVWEGEETEAPVVVLDGEESSADSEDSTDSESSVDGEGNTGAGANDSDAAGNSAGSEDGTGVGENSSDAAGTGAGSEGIAGGSGAGNETGASSADSESSTNAGENTGA